MELLDKDGTRKVLGITTEKLNLNILILQHCLKHNKLDVTQDPESFKKALNSEAMLNIFMCRDMNTSNLNLYVLQEKLKSKESKQKVEKL